MWLTPGNQIGAAGARSLADGLKELKGLEKLRLGGECVLGCWRSPTVANDTHAHITPREWWWVWVGAWWMDENVDVHAC